MMQTATRYVHCYHNTCNLGDTFQTYALARLMPAPVSGMYRHKMHPVEENELFVVNGYLHDLPVPIPETLFAGIFIGANINAHVSWIKRSKLPIGSRDPGSSALLKTHGVDSQMIGCSTLTLPKYSGPRTGVLHIDDGHNCPMTQDNGFVIWPQAWTQTVGMLELIKTSALVVTQRLHVILPCLALGTPVYVSEQLKNQVMQPQRFSLLDYLGFKYDEPVQMDVSELANTYRKFLSEGLQQKLQELPDWQHPHMPVPKEIISIFRYQR